MKNPKKNNVMRDALGLLVNVDETELEDAHFALVEGQKLVVRGWVADDEVKEIPIGVFLPGITFITEAIVDVLNRYEWKVADPVGGEDEGH